MAKTEVKARKKLFWPIVLLLVSVIPTLYWDSLIHEIGVDVISQTIKIAKYSIATISWLSVAWLAIRLVDVVIWDGLVAPRLGGTVPRLLKDVVAAVIFIIAITGIVGGVFNLPVSGIWATSGVVGLVVGLAVQSMIADVFSGIAINIDRPFKIGDWVRLNLRGIPDMIGCVEEVNWRSTRIKTTDGVRHIVPNSLLGQIIVTNLCEPELRSRFELLFTLDFEVPPERALRILNAGVKAAKGPLADPAPKARVNGITEWGVEYKVRYWLLPADFSPNKGRNAVCSSILEHLHHAGVTLAYQKQDLYVAEMPNRQLTLETDRKALVRRIDIFKSLESTEVDSLSQRITQRQFRAGDQIVKKDDPGESMYIVVEGLLFVYADLEGDGTTTTRVGKLIPGDFFGEMSLLTGEPRSATVEAATDTIVYEITRSDIEDLLAERPNIANRITQVIAERRVSNLKTRDKLSHEEHHEETKNLADQLLGKMRGFFKGLGLGD